MTRDLLGLRVQGRCPLDDFFNVLMVWRKSNYRVGHRAKQKGGASYQSVIPDIFNQEPRVFTFFFVREDKRHVGEG